MHEPEDGQAQLALLKTVRCMKMDQVGGITLSLNRIESSTSYHKGQNNKPDCGLVYIVK